jgi:iron complex outermembrane recepter protein
MSVGMVLSKGGVFLSLSLVLLAPVLALAQPGAQVTGRVTDPSGSPVVGARVSLRMGVVERQHSIADPRGRYTFQGLSTGDYTVTVSAPHFRRASKQIHVSSGALQPLVLDFQLTLLPVSQKVTVLGEPGYQVSVANAATKTNTPILDVPQDIATVNQSLMEDQQDLDLADAAENVSGVARANPVAAGQMNNLFAIRGFQLDYDNNYLLDGLKYPGFAASDLANIQEVEVLKGPASVLYGQAEAGGVVNLITKKPLEAPFVSLDFTGGSFGFGRAQFDVSGPLDRSHSLLYRVDGAYQNGDEDEDFRHFVHTHHTFIAPTLLWKPKAGTSLSLTGEFMNEAGTTDDGVPAVGDRPAPVPITSFYGEPWNDAHTRDTQLGYRLHHQLGKKWSLDNAFSWYRDNNYYFAAESESLETNNSTLLRILDAFSFPENFRYSETNLTGTFSTGPITHQILVGLDLGWVSSGFIGPEVNYPSIDIYDPVYNLLTPAQAAQLLTPSNPSYYPFNTVGTNQVTGVYVQDLISLGRSVKLLVGAREDIARQESVDEIYNSVTRQDNNALSPRVGLVYAPLSNVSLYASYSRSFLPAPLGNVSPTGQSFLAPEYATQYEAGVKTSNFRNRLSSTLSVFDIRETNVLDPDPTNVNFYVQIGEERSKGVDLDVTGRLANGWNLLFSYEFDQAQIIADNTLPVGSMLIDAPRDSGHLWTTYEIGRGRLHRLGFGGGLSAIGKQYGDVDDTFVLPGYATVDAGLFYTPHATDRTSWKLSAKIDNLLDRSYYETATGVAEIRPGAPFEAFGSVQFTFH